MSTTAEYHLHVALLLFCVWAGKAVAETQRFRSRKPEFVTVRVRNQPGARPEGPLALPAFGVRPDRR